MFMRYFKNYILPVILIITFTAPLFLYKFDSFKEDYQETIDYDYVAYTMAMGRAKNVSAQVYHDLLKAKYDTLLDFNGGVNEYLSYTPLIMWARGLTTYFYSKKCS